MIGKLTGQIDDIYLDSIIIDVAGVGYEVFCSAAVSTHAEKLKLSATNDPKITVYIETIVREDSFELFGFASLLEKNTFLMLNKVKGVGKRLALTIISAISVEAIIDAIIAENDKIFATVSGVGKKMSERIIVELKSSCEKLMQSSNIISSGKKDFLPDPHEQGHFLQQNNDEISGKSQVNKQVSLINSSNLKLDAISALTNLGISYNDAALCVSKILKEKPNVQLEELIRMALSNSYS